MGMGKGPRVHLPQEKCTSLPPKLDPQPLEKKISPDGPGKEGGWWPTFPKTNTLFHPWIWALCPWRKSLPWWFFWGWGPMSPGSVMSDCKTLGYTFGYTLGYTFGLHFGVTHCITHWVTLVGYTLHFWLLVALWVTLWRCCHTSIQASPVRQDNITQACWMFASNLELIQHRNTFSCVKMQKKKFPPDGPGEGAEGASPPGPVHYSPHEFGPSAPGKIFSPDGPLREGGEGPPSPGPVHYSPHEFRPSAPRKKFSPHGPLREGGEGPPSPGPVHYSPHEFRPSAPEKNFSPDGPLREGGEGPPSPGPVHYSPHEFRPSAPGKNFFPDGPVHPDLLSIWPLLATTSCLTTFSHHIFFDHF